MQMRIDLPESPATSHDDGQIIYEKILALLQRPLHTSYAKQAANFSAIYFFRQRVIRIFLGKTKKYLLIYTTPEADDAESSSDNSPQEQNKPLRFDLPLNIDDSLDVSPLESTMNELWKLADANATVERLGCCSDFIECSNAKRCTKEDNIEYWGCYYRENLEKGRIFYGENKTV